MTFGPEYTKINSIWKRDERGRVLLGQWATDELAYLAELPWSWTEKVDGTNIRLHWDGEQVTIGGRTDNAQLPQKLVENVRPLRLHAKPWLNQFGGADDVTVYGEGYGAGIQKGGVYRPDQALIVFDVLVGGFWLNREGVADVAKGLGLDVVPFIGEMTPVAAWHRVMELESRWPGAPIEGMVGRPLVDLFDRQGHRILMKIKVKDWQDAASRQGAAA